MARPLSCSKCDGWGCTKCSITINDGVTVDKYAIDDCYNDNEIAGWQVYLGRVPLWVHKDLERATESSIDSFNYATAVHAFRLAGDKKMRAMEALLKVSQLFYQVFDERRAQLSIEKNKASAMATAANKEYIAAAAVYKKEAMKNRGARWNAERVEKKAKYIID